MIVVLGRPGLELSPGDGSARPGGRAGRIALRLRRLGAPTELLGSVGEDEAGERLVLELARAGIGHAAVLRDPAATTPLESMGAGGGDTTAEGPSGRPPRIDAGDVELGLRYLPECRVLVVADELEADAARAALEGAAFHSAAVIALLPVGRPIPDGLAGRAVILAVPAADPADAPAFEDFVAAYAAGLHDGRTAPAAEAAARAASGWAPAPT